MKIIFISGSHRKNSESTRIGKIVEQELKNLSPEITTDWIDLGDQPLPMWEESIWTGKGDLFELWKPYKSKLEEASAAVVLSPEYGGMASPALKNFLLFVGHSLAHKPIQLVTISSSVGGAYPVSELRASGYKNSRILYVPDHIIVRHCVDLFKEKPDKKSEEEKLLKRIHYNLQVFLEYAKALSTVRSSGVIDLRTHPNGF